MGATCASICLSCCNMLRVENRTSAYAWVQLCYTCSQTTTTYNIHKSCMKNLTIFKFEPTTPNMLQHIGTRWPNACNMFHPTMLRYVALKSWDCLAGALCSCKWISCQSSGVQIPHDICTRFRHYLYSTQCSWKIKYLYLYSGRGRILIYQFFCGHDTCMQ